MQYIPILYLVIFLYNTIHTEYMHQYIPIPPCGSIGMYHGVIALKTCQNKPQYIPIPPQHARRWCQSERIIARICMY